MGAATAGAVTLSFAQANDGGGNVDSSLMPPSLSATFFSVSEVDGTNQTLTLLYFGLDGSNRTPSANTTTIAGNSARGWRPVANDPAEGAGQSIPNATGTAGALTCQVISTGNIRGRALVNVGGVNASYAFAAIPL
jgi:hypothetical protein